MEKQWFNHFKKHLGIHQLKSIQSFKALTSAMRTSSWRKVAEAKNQVKERRAPGEDGIMPEVLARINIDDIIQSFFYKKPLEKIGLKVS